MKILVLMPVGQDYSAIGGEICKNLPENIFDNTMIMSMIVDYLLETGVTDNYGVAVVNAIMACNNLYDEAVANGEDIIIFGNVGIDKEFDMVFNFQDPDDDTLEYKDLLIEKIVDIVSIGDVSKEEMEIFNLHSADESILTLKNCKATAELMSELIASKPVDVRAQYAEILELQRTHIGEIENKFNVN